MKTFPLILLALGAGCAARQWVNPDKTPEQIKADLYECRVEGKLLWSVSGKLVRECMAVRGNRLERK